MTRARRYAMLAAAATLALVPIMSVEPAGAADMIGAPHPATTLDTQPAAALSQSSSGPLVIVVDLSSSMGEDDGTGVIKIDAAKKSLQEVVRAQPPGAEIGLWTYPGGGVDDDSCAVGGWVPGAEVGPVADPSSLSAAIDALEVGNNTPTGPALSAVADDLRQRGITKATLLLVSDGEANCGADACEVAKSLVADGYDITVHAMGYQISSAGASELGCIADATSGRYFDAQDSDQLDEFIKEQAIRTLELDVDAPAADTIAGTSVTITAEVTNPSAVTISDVELSLVFTSATAHPLFPAVVPPKYPLGNLPPGGSQRRSWTVQTAVDTGGGTARWQIAATAPAGGSAYKYGDIAVVGADDAINRAGTWLKDIYRRGGKIAILGDSYSSGEGAGDYTVASSSGGNKCHQSYRTYLASHFGDKATRIIACSGAVTADYWSAQSGKVQPQVDQLSNDLLSPVDAVFLTFGGNDIGFGNLASWCVYENSVNGIAPSAVCDVAILTKIKTLAESSDLTDRLASLYASVYRTVNTRQQVTARDGRVAPVVVLPYPNILDVQTDGGCYGFSADAARAARGLLTKLNNTIEAAVAQAHGQGLRSLFYAGPISTAFTGHTACAATDPFVNDAGIVQALSNALASDRYVREMLHPNRAGYRAETATLFAWSNSIEPTGEAFSGGDAPLEPTVEKTSPVKAPVLVDVGSRTGAAPRLAAGSAVRLRADTYRPNSAVLVTLNSRPVALANLTADDSGRIDEVVMIPHDAAPGGHTIELTGVDPSGSLLDRSAPIAVQLETPDWLWPALTASGLCLLGGLALLLMRRHEPSRWYNHIHRKVPGNR